MKTLLLFVISLVGLAVARGWAEFDSVALAGLIVGLIAGIAGCLRALVAIMDALSKPGQRKLYRFVLLFSLVFLILASVSSCLALGAAVGELVDRASDPEPAAVVPTPERVFTVPTVTATQPATPAFPPTPITPLCLVAVAMWPCVHLVQSGESLSSIAKLRYQLPGDVNPQHAEVICLENIEFLTRQFFEVVHPNERKNWDNNPCNFVLPGNALIIPPPPR